MSLIPSAKFKKDVQHDGLIGKLKSPGRITFVIAALEAYEQAERQRLPEIQQLSHLYELYKQCNIWLKLKNDKTTEKSVTRALNVSSLRDDIPKEIATRFPAYWNALNRFEAAKANPFLGQTRAPQGVYAHESAVYQSNKMNGKYSKPSGQRLTAGATGLDSEYNQLQDPSHARHKAWKTSNLYAPLRNGVRFQQLSESQFRELDKLCKGQFNVLYLSKIQRLQYMAIIEGGLLKRPNGSLITLLAGQSLKDELSASVYAIDKYGNLFVTTENDHPGRKINHTTLCAGHEVLCAGTMSIKAGKLRIITNNSGHYTPSTAHLQQAVDMLQRAGVPMGEVVVIDQAQDHLQLSAADFMANRFDREMPDRMTAAIYSKTA